MTDILQALSNRLRCAIAPAACVSAVLACAPGTPAAEPLPEIRMHVDASDAPRRILHGRLEIPARPGPLRLSYPKWIPGEHGPSGPLRDMAGLRVAADGESIPWRRDPVEMHAFAVTVPDGVGALTVELDFLSGPKARGFTSGAFATERMIAVSWNHLLMVPGDAPPGERMVRASIRLPEGWRYGTALKTASESDGIVTFEPVSLARLVDSPLIAGRHFRSIPLSNAGGASVRMDIVADSDAALELSDERIGNFQRLVAEADAMFGARHFEDYVFLVSLSDHISHFGLEHHDSSDNRSLERTFVDDDRFRLRAGLLPHEIVHSWNGKYRRPAGMATADFTEPQVTDLLWVYEGLTSYLGDVLTARSGLWSPEEFRESLSRDAAGLVNRKGRVWRPLADTTRSSQVVFGSPGEWGNWRRRADFYSEGALIWLEADVLIRSRTNGKRSLDDFCRSFHGGTPGPPEVAAYTFDDLTDALNEIVPHDWAAFFRARIEGPTEEPPLDGLERSGWELGYASERGAIQKSVESVRETTDLSHSIGVTLGKSGVVSDVVPGSPATRAGLAPGMKIVAVDGRRYDPKRLRAAIAAAAEDGGVLELLVENAEFFRTFRVQYDEGEKYPALIRRAKRPDVLADIIAPRADTP